MEIKDNTLYLEGISMNYEPNIDLIIYVNGKEYDYETVNRDVNKYTMDEVCFYGSTFKLKVQLGDVEQYNIAFFSRIGNVEVQKREFRYSKTMPLAKTYEKSYYRKGEWAVRLEGRELVVRKFLDLTENINYEREFVEEVTKKKKFSDVKSMIDLRQMAQTFLAEKNPKKKIWLLSDRVNAADDNGDAMFRFLKKKNDKDIDAYFVINSDCDDYERLQKYGKVVARGTKQHYLLHLVADFIVSSAGDEYVINPWSNDTDKAEVVRDYLARHQYIFLQHGVTKDDISGWLNRYNKNIKGFVCTAPREAKSIMDYDYYYGEENVWLTGFPRHDKLYHDEKNYIVIMPTWRQYLTVSSGTENKLVDEFENSDYCVFYNDLINNERLLEAAEKYGYKICFMPHPGIKRNGIQYFHQDPRVEFLDLIKSIVKHTQRQV